MENSMQKRNWKLHDIFLWTWHHSARSHLSSLSFSKFPSGKAFEFWIIIPQIHWLATVWVEPDFITACTQGQSLLILLGLGPPNLLNGTYPTYYLWVCHCQPSCISITQVDKLLTGKNTAIHSQNYEKPLQISATFPKGFGLFSRTGEILNSSLWLL